MNILLVSKDLIAGNLAALMSQEGHDVKLFIQEKKSKESFDNIVTKTENWKKELKWVGKAGLIIFDDIGYGAIQEKLRKQGYSVVGGSEKGDFLEENRQHCKEIFAFYGMKTVPLFNLDNVSDAIKFIKKYRGAWVIKQNGRMSKSLNYVGRREDGEDVISVLESYKDSSYRDVVVSLQKRIDGVEIGVGRYFNGTDWVGPLEINIEHKKLFPGGIGPTTSEMGTLAWYDDNENNKLFQETLAKLKPYLQEIDFRGDAEINCIVNEEGAFPLEATMRFGSPIIHLHSEIHQSPWGDFLKAVADGKPYDLKWKKGYGLVVVIAVPPFPEFHHKNLTHFSPAGVHVYFGDKLKDKMSHIHFEEIACRKDKENAQYYIAGNSGYVLYVTGMGKTVEEARKETYGIIDEIYVPKMFYRNDIGLKFIEKDFSLLKKWGYI